MNILVLLPVNDRHRAILESSAPGEDFIYTSSDAATREQIADADVILGNIDPGMAHGMRASPAVTIADRRL